MPFVIAGHEYRRFAAGEYGDPADRTRDRILDVAGGDQHVEIGPRRVEGQPGFKMPITEDPELHDTRSGPHGACCRMTRMPLRSVKR